MAHHKLITMELKKMPYELSVHWFSFGPWMIVWINKNQFWILEKEKKIKIFLERKTTQQKFEFSLKGIFIIAFLKKNFLHCIAIQWNAFNAVNWCISSMKWKCDEMKMVDETKNDKL